MPPPCCGGLGSRRRSAAPPQSSGETLARLRQPPPSPINQTYSPIISTWVQSCRWQPNYSNNFEEIDENKHHQVLNYYLGFLVMLTKSNKTTYYKWRYWEKNTSICVIPREKFNLDLEGQTSGEGIGSFAFEPLSSNWTRLRWRGFRVGGNMSYSTTL